MEQMVGMWLAVHAPNTMSGEFLVERDRIASQWPSAPQHPSDYPRGAFVGAIKING